jgi:hypothetical protein
MATGISLGNRNPADLLPAAQQRARQLYKTLVRYAAELSAADELDPQVRQRGLAVVRRAAECANRLAADTDQSLLRRNALAPQSSPDSPQEADADE